MSAENKSFPTRIKDKAVDGALWTAEKSTFVTLPLAATIVVLTPLTLGAAAPFMAVDGGGYLLFKNARNRRKNKQG